jgi:hypothetical protein
MVQEMGEGVEGRERERGREGGREGECIEFWECSIEHVSLFPSRPET